MRSDPGRRLAVILYALVSAGGLALAALGEHTPLGIVLPGQVPYAFVLFVLVLLGIGMFHHHTLHVSLTGAAVITLYTAILAPDHHPSPATPGLLPHFLHEVEHTLLNLGGLMLGFTLLADLFERSHLPDSLVRVLPKRPALAAFTLLLIVWVLSSFLDNIAAAMIGGVMVLRTFKSDVSVAYL
ncbi:MAG: citrate transporter, partial [Phycisphaerales bacterium]|nr:citrate transporter [Phycisphaerales bacterium]